MRNAVRNILLSNRQLKYLSQVTSFALALSLRKITNSYAGNCIRVRRSNDNAELDIEFVGDELNTVQLLNFVGANTGFITTWYDQSGNNRNAIQTTASLQPSIVLNGVLSTSNNRPTVYSSGGKYLVINYGSVTASAFNVVAKVLAGSPVNFGIFCFRQAAGFVNGNFSVLLGGAIDSSSLPYSVTTGFIQSTYFSINNQSQLSQVQSLIPADAFSSTQFINVRQGTLAGSLFADSIDVASRWLVGSISEFLVWDGGQQYSQAQLIESNQNKYYR